MELQTGDLVELQVDANFIPAGRYHFKREEDDMIILQVAEDVEIGLSSHFWKPFLKQISDTNIRPTTIKEFLDGYFEGLGQVSRVDTSGISDRHTYCTIKPRHLPSIQKRFAQRGQLMKNSWTQ